MIKFSVFDSDSLVGSTGTWVEIGVRYLSAKKVDNFSRHHRQNFSEVSDLEEVVSVTSHYDRLEAFRVKNERFVTKYHFVSSVPQPASGA